MARTSETRFPWKRARSVTAEETERFRRAIEATTGKPRAPRGRPPKPAGERYRSTTIRLHPAILEWARREAGRRGVGYQSVINATLLRHAGR